MKNITLIARGVLLETIRRRDVYVLTLLVAIFAAGALAFRIAGTESDANSRFAMGLGLTLALWAGKILTLVIAVRQVPQEIEARTLHPILAKPVGRAQFLIGKILGAWLAGVVSTVFLVVLAWGPLPRLADQGMSAFVQMLLLHGAALAVIAALGVGASIVLPKAVNLVLLFLLVFFGGGASGLLAAQSELRLGERTANWVSGYIPDFGLLDLVNQYAEGMGALAWSTFALRGVYALILTLICVAGAAAIFDRKPLP